MDVWGIVLDYISHRELAILIALTDLISERNSPIIVTLDTRLHALYKAHYNLLASS